MRNLVFFMTLLALVSCQPAEEAAPDAATEEAAPTTDSMDATVSEPDHYMTEFENDHVRAVRIRYAAGEETQMHSHPASVSVFLTDGEGVLVLEDGSEQEINFKAGDTLWMDAQSHQPRAKTDFELIQIELKDGGAEAAPEEAPGEAKDATAVEPDHYKVELENDRVRVVRITYAAGDEAAVHSHPNGVLVFLTDGSSELISEDGTKREDSWKAGETMWAPAETHHGKANTDFEIFLVEIKG
jgi:quercetin dioxygenase-like cupin family protein